MNLSDIPKSNLPGWPWSDIPQSHPKIMHEVKTWPKISIVTPSYNQAQFLEETIRSVLFQGYPNLEYIIIDGGSTDGSVEIIKKYESWLSYWVSEKDSGQSHAINKGFSKSSGEVMAWINSDDYYVKGAFYSVAQAFLNNQTLWIAGLTNRVDENGEIIISGKHYKESLEDWFVGSPYLQPGIFWRRSLWEKSGNLDENLQYSFDYDLLMRFIQYQTYAYWVDRCIAHFRIHPNSKTTKDQLKFMPEREKIYKRYPLKGFSLKQRLSIYIKRQKRKSKIYMRLSLR